MDLVNAHPTDWAQQIRLNYPGKSQHWYSKASLAVYKHYLNYKLGLNLAAEPDRNNEKDREANKREFG